MVLLSLSEELAQELKQFVKTRLKTIEFVTARIDPSISSRESDLIIEAMKQEVYVLNGLMDAMGEKVKGE